ncbi:MAG: hypothetical protein JEY94_01825 [Melioribacteraceae bacterium]|nr:hypothetical protein [Melioribacteraceae bacterium]
MTINSATSVHYNKPDINSGNTVPKTIKTDVKSFNAYTKSRLNDSKIYTKDGAFVYNRVLNKTEQTEITTKTVQTDSFKRSETIGNTIYNAQGKLVSNANSSSIHESYKAIKQNIKEQIEFLFGSFIKDEENINEFDDAGNKLKTFYQNNPQALEQISKGKIPEYFNVENTAKRQFEIALWSYNKDDDPEEFYNKSVELINQAYGDVEKKLPFELPDIVKNTREAVLDALKQFRDGISKEDIVFGKPNE